MSFVLRAKGSFHRGAEVAEVVTTTFFSLRMEEKEDAETKCLLILDMKNVIYCAVYTYRC